jgi:ribosome biogenesis GTPase / thiamine phosphate phosphatase
LKKGLVIKSTGNWFIIRAENGELLNCRIKGNFRIKDIRSTNPVAIGDWVEYKVTGENKPGRSEKSGVITEICDRRNYIVRRSQNLSKQAHIIAANIDLAFLVTTINFPITSTTFLDRFLASAEAYRIPVALVFNKTDLYNTEETDFMEYLIGVYEKIGYKCLKTSATIGTGIDDLRKLMKDKTTVFSGHSGVGKSTLINYVEPRLNLKTDIISDYHQKGKHTTSYSELFELGFGGYIIDTPGIKGFGMLDMEPWEISHYFPEIFRIASGCQYKNCTHTHEPECAVKDAVKEGVVAETRYISYIGLFESDNDKYRKPPV